MAIPAEHIFLKIYIFKKRQEKRARVHLALDCVSNKIVTRQLVLVRFVLALLEHGQQLQHEMMLVAKLFYVP